MKFIKALFKAISIFLKSYKNNDTLTYQPDPSFDLTNKSSYASTLRIGTLHSSKPLCPNCGIEIKKHPLAKTKCKSCGLFMFKRTRPFDNNQVTVTEKEAELIDIEWQKVTGVYETIQKEKEDELQIAADLKKSMHTEPTKNQIKWKVLEKAAAKAIKERHAGGLGNIRFDMAELLLVEYKRKEALDMFLEDAVIQLNLIVHVHTSADPSIQKYINKHKPEFTSVAGGLSARIFQLVEDLKLSNSELKSKFIAASERIRISFKSFYDVEEEWAEFLKQTGFKSS